MPSRASVPLRSAKGSIPSTRTVPGRGRDQPRDQPQKRGLAAAIAPDDADARFGQMQVQPGKNVFPANAIARILASLIPIISRLLPDAGVIAAPADPPQ